MAGVSIRFGCRVEAWERCDVDETNRLEVIPSVRCVENSALNEVSEVIVPCLFIQIVLCEGSIVAEQDWAELIAQWIAATERHVELVRFTVIPELHERVFTVLSRAAFDERSTLVVTVNGGTVEPD